MIIRSFKNNVRKLNNNNSNVIVCLKYKLYNIIII